MIDLQHQYAPSPEYPAPFAKLHNRPISTAALTVEPGADVARPFSRENPGRPFLRPAPSAVDGRLIWHELGKPPRLLPPCTLHEPVKASVAATCQAKANKDAHSIETLNQAKTITTRRGC